MKKYFVILLIVMLQFTDINAQDIIDSSAPKRPTWIKEIPKGEFFIYFSGMTTNNSSLEEAKEIAISNALSEIVMRNEVCVESEISTFEEETQEDIFSKITKEINLKGTSTLIKGLEKEEEYWEIVETDKSTLYRYWILMKIPKKKYINHSFTITELERSYGITPIIKSAFIPGWGQFQKKQTLKGVLLLTGFTASLTTGIISYNLSKSYQKDAEDAVGAEWIKYYNDMSDQYYLVSIISFILSGAIYGYNMFDVISSKGAKIYALNENNEIYISMNNKKLSMQLKITMTL